MKIRLLPLLLALCLALGTSAAALSTEDFRQGQLSGVAAAADGALLVTDVYNKVVWRVEAGSVTRYAGAISAAGVSGEPAAVYHDAAADQAYFMEPWDIAPFLDGYAVTDAQSNVVRYIADGRVYTLAGSGKAQRTDGTGKSAAFYRPTGLAAAGDGSLYVADTGNGAIRRIGKDGTVTTLVSGLSEPTGLCLSDGILYVAETGRSRICRIANGQAQSFAGVSVEAEDEGEYYGGYADGPAATARFDHPQGLAAGADGTLYVADTGNSAVRAIRDGRVWTLARSSDSTQLPVRPCGMAVRGDTLHVADRFVGNLLSVSLAQKTYSDVAPGAWYADAVAMATRNGIANGTSDTTFSPQESVSRAMFVTMLSRVHQVADGSAVIRGDSTFSDVPSGQWYFDAVGWAADAGIVNGYQGSYMPAADVTRAQMVAMLYRYASAQEMDTAAASGRFESFPDAGSTPS